MILIVLIHPPEVAHADEQGRMNQAKNVSRLGLAKSLPVANIMGDIAKLDKNEAQK